MSVLKKLQEQIHSSTGGLVANWFPTASNEIGSFGNIRRHRFNRLSTLKSRGISYQIEESGAGPANYEKSLGVKVSVDAHAKADVDDVAGGGGSGSAKLSLKKAGSFLFQVKGMKERRLADIDRMFNDLAMAIISGNIDWDEDYAVVVGDWPCDVASVVVSEKKGGELTLTGGFNPSEEVPLAKAGVRVKPSFSVSDAESFVGEEGAVPLLRLMGLKISFGPEPPTPFGVALVEKIRNWFSSDIQPELFKVPLPAEAGREFQSCLEFKGDESAKLYLGNLGLEDFLSYGEREEGESEEIPGDNEQDSGLELEAYDYEIKSEASG